MNRFQPSLLFRCRGQRGFSLVELAVAIGVFSFAIVGIIGILPVGLRSAYTSVNEMGAVNLARSVEADFRLASTLSTTSTPLANTPFYNISNPPPTSSTPYAIKTYFDSTNQIVTSVSNAKYLLTIQQLPFDQTQIGTTGTYFNSLEPNRLLITISWPPGNSTKPDGILETIISIPR